MLNFVMRVCVWGRGGWGRQITFPEFNKRVMADDRVLAMIAIDW